ncbi:MAG: hypothetical protein HYU41_16445 [Candidatus Rokubacteria bacterium]|nr:hypothetical protein [Candidatus Rokubacteria bacterium]
MPSEKRDEALAHHIRPMHILEQQNQRLSGGEPGDQLAHADAEGVLLELVLPAGVQWELGEPIPPPPAPEDVDPTLWEAALAHFPLATETITEFETDTLVEKCCNASGGFFFERLKIAIPTVTLKILVPHVPAGAVATLPVKIVVPPGVPLLPGNILPIRSSIQTLFTPDIHRSCPGHDTPDEDPKDCLRDALGAAVSCLGLIPGVGCAGIFFSVWGSQAGACSAAGGGADEKASWLATTMLGLFNGLAQCFVKETVLGKIIDGALCLKGWKDAFDSCRKKPPGRDRDIVIVGSFDPNAKVGAGGEGAELRISGEEPLPYAIFFENLETATAAAQHVIVVDQLDAARLDLATFELGPIRVGDREIVPPPGLAQYTTDVDLRPGQPLILRVEAGLDASTGVATWRFTSLDPDTGLPTEDPLAGFLPPNRQPPEGAGSVILIVKPRPGLAPNTQICNQARIVFDVNEPIDTDVWCNTIGLDTTPPVTIASADPAPNAHGWNKTDVTVTLTATDEAGGSGVKEIVWTLAGAGTGGATSPGSTATIPITAEGETTVSYFARDNAGNAEGAKTLTVRIDKTPPVITGSRSPDANAHGWNNTDVTVSFACSDGLSGIDTCGPTPQVVSGEGVDQAREAAAVDKAGNTASASVGGINIDKTPPVVIGSRNPEPNAFGWNNTDVTVSFACSDGLSGIDTCGPTPQVVSAEGAGQARSAMAADRAGNTASATVAGINIDKTPPSIAGLPAPDCALWPPDHKLVEVAKVAASDGLSGLANSLGLAVSSNEPVLGVGDGHHAPDWVVTMTSDSSGTIQLRRERSGAGNGRVYTMDASASDRAGNLAAAAAQCKVPHDQGRRR